MPRAARTRLRALLGRVLDEVEDMAPGLRQAIEEALR
jgi:hypothetical protein